MRLIAPNLKFIRVESRVDCCAEMIRIALDGQRARVWGIALYAGNSLNEWRWASWGATNLLVRWKLHDRFEFVVFRWRNPCLNSTWRGDSEGCPHRGIMALIIPHHHNTSSLDLSKREIFERRTCIQFSISPSAPTCWPIASWTVDTEASPQRHFVTNQCHHHGNY